MFKATLHQLLGQYILYVVLKHQISIPSFLLLTVGRTKGLTKYLYHLTQICISVCSQLQKSGIRPLLLEKIPKINKRSGTFCGLQSKGLRFRTFSWICVPKIGHQLEIPKPIASQIAVFLAMRTKFDDYSTPLVYLALQTTCYYLFFQFCNENFSCKYGQGVASVTLTRVTLC